MTPVSTVSPLSIEHIPESRFGDWFLGTETWVNYVLEPAVRDLERLVVDRRSSYPVVLDVGCGWGRSFNYLKESFSPNRLIGADINSEMLKKASEHARIHGIDVELVQGNSSNLRLPDESVDLLFCHQTFHHLVDQNAAIQEFYRVLKRGGLLLFAESTRAYIHSWIIKLLFRHPMGVQKSADEYLELIRKAGFSIDERSVSLPYLWWSRPDIGVLENWFGRKPPLNREETLVNTVAIRP